MLVDEKKNARHGTSEMKLASITQSLSTTVSSVDTHTRSLTTAGIRLND